MTPAMSRISSSNQSYEPVPQGEREGEASPRNATAGDFFTSSEKPSVSPEGSPQHVEGSNSNANPLTRSISSAVGVHVPGNLPLSEQIRRAPAEREPGARAIKTVDSLRRELAASSSVNDFRSTLDALVLTVLDKLIRKEGDQNVAGRTKVIEIGTYLRGNSSELSVQFGFETLKEIFEASPGSDQADSVLHELCILSISGGSDTIKARAWQLFSDCVENNNGSLKPGVVLQHYFSIANQCENSEIALAALDQFEKMLTPPSSVFTTAMVEHKFRALMTSTVKEVGRLATAHRLRIVQSFRMRFPREDDGSAERSLETKQRELDISAPTLNYRTFRDF